MRLLILVIGFVVVSGSIASADVTVEMKHDGEAQMMFATEDKLAVPTDGGTMIFRGDKKLIWMVDLKSGTYREMTEADVAELGKKVTDAKAQMADALKNLPPEQREMAEKMMSGQMPSGMAEVAEKRVKSLGQSRKINGFQTKGYEVYRDDVVREEVWAAEPKELGFSLDDLKVFEKLGEFMSGMTSGMEDVFDRYTKDYEKPSEDEVPGFPVLTIGKAEDGSVRFRTELVRIDKDKIAAERFELPKGLKKTALEMGN